MNKTQKILVATDGSPDALKAATYAGDLARSLDAKVTVLMVQNEDIIVASAWGLGERPKEQVQGVMSVEEVRAMLEKRATEKELADTVAAIGKLPTTPLVEHRWGHAASEVCSFALSNDIDLIVVGSHGRSGLKRALLGSVSHAVANNAHCPVTIVR